MDESCDIYAELLGLPSGRRPPDYYALLGLPPAENDVARIHRAARRRSRGSRTCWPASTPTLLNNSWPTSPRPAPCSRRPRLANGTTQGCATNLIFIRNRRLQRHRMPTDCCPRRSAIARQCRRRRLLRPDRPSPMRRTRPLRRRRRRDGQTRSEVHLCRPIARWPPLPRPRRDWWRDRARRFRPRRPSRRTTCRPYHRQRMSRCPRPGTQGSKIGCRRHSWDTARENLRRSCGAAALPASARKWRSSWFCCACWRRSG